MALSRRGFLMDGPSLAVARYFFEVHANGRAIADDQGYDLASAQEACQEVLATLADIAKDRPPDGCPREVAITARDRTGREVFTASLALRVEWHNRSTLWAASGFAGSSEEEDKLCAPDQRLKASPGAARLRKRGMS
jgi:hypothetical protein